MTPYVSEEESNKRLESPLNAIVALNLKGPGRPKGTTNTPRKLRELAGTLAHFHTAKQVADELGLTPQQVHHYKHGRTTFGKEDEELKDKIDKNLEEFDNQTIAVKRDAMSKLKLAMGLITEKSLADCKPVALASVAKDMATIHEKLTLKREEKVEKNTVIFYSPGNNDIKDYGDVITVKPEAEE